MKKTLSTLALALIIGAMPLAAQVKFSKLEPEALFAAAKSEGKFVFVDLYATWCPPCKMMDRDVFPKAEVGKYMNANFINAKYDVDQKTGQVLSREYGVSSIPTYLIFNAEGTLVGRMAGAQPAAEFIENMKRILAEKKK